MRTAILAPALAALAACDHHDHDDFDDPPPVPVFLEAERNDDPLTANYFGVLRPGHRFFIDGFVRDDLADPFDGFAFTAGEPLHVDFLLFESNAAADLDVCLYDPQIDQTVACFATDSHPESGGVDVFAGGLDFHLVVESFVADSTYTLEIDVQPLFARAALSEEAAGGLAGSGARSEHAVDARDDYRIAKPEPRPLLERVLEFDAEHGILLERIFLYPQEL